VPYRGGAPALVDLLGGRVQVRFGVLPESIGYIKDGKLRALAVTTTTRNEFLPDVPTVSDFVPGYEASSVQGIAAPKGTPPEIVERLNREINAGLATATLKARFATLGSTVFPISPAEFRKFPEDETEKWGKVVKFSGAKAE
jgi:tripartite-type tricarboxylate transporter receptor subunit TctC